MPSLDTDFCHGVPHFETRQPEAIHRVETIKAGGRTFAKCGCGHVWEVLPGGSIECPIEDIEADFSDDLRRITRERDRRLANRRLLAEIDQFALRLVAGGL